MTDILDLHDWRVTSTRQEDDELVIEAEYGIPPAACMKCGVIGRLYKHGPKPISTNETRTICPSCSERFHTEDHPQHDSLTTR